MVINFKRYIKREDLLDPSDKIVCGVSGGVDSMALCSLLINCGYKVSIAHCNFSLRADESDGDEALVREFAEQNGITFHHIKFDTKGYSKENGLSTQIAARELRYNWFEELCSEYGYTKIAIAHNSDDTIETFFINLIRSTGVNGLTGIQNRNGKIVRPLIFASRADILEYAKQNDIKYRTDSSNLSSAYLRNWIRLELLPKITKRVENFSSSMLQNMQHISSHNSLFKKMLERVKSEVLNEEKGDIRIDLSKVKEYGDDSSELLFELIRDYGFTARNTRSILEINDSGRLFLAANYRAVVDRGILIIRKNRDKIASKIEITIIDNPKEVEAIKKIDFRALDKDTIYISGDKIEGELLLRPWSHGDKFRPIGMRGEKKISDFLTDLKCNIFEKELQEVVEYRGEIIWVVGKRVSEIYKIEANTKKIIKISYLCR